MELFKAHRQWQTRPADERFWTVQEGAAACAEYKAASVEKPAPHDALRAEAIEGDIHLVGRSGIPARLTHHAFGQLAQRAGAPASYLRDLPATLAVQNINHGLKVHLDQTGSSLALFQQEDAGYVLRALTSERYTRIWNSDIMEKLLDFVAQGWHVPPARPVHDDPRARPATEADVSALQSQRGAAIKVGDMIAPAGVYVSDHDCFVFLVDETHPLDNGAGEPLGRGFFAWNSEVGDKAFGLMTFLYDAVCGNHIVWGAREVAEFRLRHVGTADRKAFAKLRVDLARYADSSAGEDQAKILRARTLEFGATKDDVLETLLGIVAKKRINLGKERLEAAYDLAAQTPRYGNPGTPWAIAQGLTELSQSSPYAEERVKIDRAAGRLLEVAVF